MCGDNNGGNSSKEMQLMRESLDQQTLQTRQALAQLVMLRDQLITETNARIEAQVRDCGGANFFEMYIHSFNYQCFVGSLRPELSSCYSKIASCSSTWPRLAVSLRTIDQV